MQLTVIHGIEKSKPNYFLIYLRMFSNSVTEGSKKFGELESFNKDSLKKIVFSGMKMINFIDKENRSYDNLIGLFNIIDLIKNCIRKLTPKEFQEVFPIEKEFKGERNESKDYFYTKKHIQARGENSLIGDEIDMFLWEYHNWEICEFVVEELSIMSAIRRFEGHKGLMEEFLEEQGVTTYTMHEDTKGKKFLTNNDTGETVKVKKKRPRYLKPV
jgi:hypothetical protein